jgi:transcription termination factor Rho
MNEETSETPPPKAHSQPPAGDSTPQTGGSHHHGERRGGDRRSRRRGRWNRLKQRDHEPIEKPSNCLNIAELESLSLEELQKKASELGVKEKTKDPIILIRGILSAHCAQAGLTMVEGILELNKGGSGFLRIPEKNYQPSSHDAYVAASLIKEYNLLPGDRVTGMSRPPRDRERFHTLLNVDLVWDKSPQALKDRKKYDELTPLYPNQRIILETEKLVSMRALDILAPLGRGQRCLIVAPPRAGKTILLQQIAEGIATNHSDIQIIMLLLDERPEEVYNARRIVQGEVISSTFDESIEHHVRMAELVIEKVHRMVENKQHVVLLLDSLTRMSRACNAMAPSKGKLMSGGIESGSLMKPRKFFSSARNVEEGGSLTIIATVLVETGSRMDDLIFEEFKGTGNMEIYLSRDLQERRIYPAIHFEKSGTRREDLLYHPDELVRIQALRKQLSEYPPLEAMEKLLEMLKATSSNAELLMRLKL